MCYHPVYLIHGVQVSLSRSVSLLSFLSSFTLSSKCDVTIHGLIKLESGDNLLELRFTGLHANELE